MNEYLSESKQCLEKLDFNVLHVVIGNESCDLDSVVSSLVYAYAIAKSSKTTTKTLTIPVLNLNERDLPLKTESVYFLAKVHVDLQNLIFRNNVDFVEINRNKDLKITLVDHHTLTSGDDWLKSVVCRIFDHRPRNPDWDWPNAEVVIKEVGSCATLIAEDILNTRLQVISETEAYLLYGTIILDTINFSEAAKRFTPLDVEIVEKLRQRFSFNPTDDKKLFEELTTARADVSRLTTLQMLRRDLKIVGKIAVPGLPISLKEMAQKADFVPSLDELSDMTNCPVILAMSLVTLDGKVARDLVAYWHGESQLGESMVKALLAHQSPDLRLQAVCTGKALRMFQQMNVEASRKQIIPILQRLQQ